MCGIVIFRSHIWSAFDGNKMYVQTHSITACLQFSIVIVWDTLWLSLVLSLEFCRAIPSLEIGSMQNAWQNFWDDKIESHNNSVDKVYAEMKTKTKQERIEITKSRSIFLYATWHDKHQTNLAWFSKLYICLFFALSPLLFNNLFIYFTLDYIMQVWVIFSLLSTKPK